MTTVTAAVAASANVTISTGLVPGQTLNGRTLVAGDLVLLPAQSDATENGLYRSAEAPERDREYSDVDRGSDGAYDKHSGLVVVDQHNGAVYLCSSAPGGTLGTSNLTFDKVSDAGNTPYLDATQTWTGDNYFRGQAVLNAIWNEDSTSVGPYIDIYRDVNLTTIPQTAGVLRYAIKNSANAFVGMAQIALRVTDDTDGSEDAYLQVQSQVAGTLSVAAYFGDGVWATGLSSKGLGTANFTTLYENGTALSSIYGALGSSNVWTNDNQFENIVRHIGVTNEDILHIRDNTTTADLYFRLESDGINGYTEASAAGTRVANFSGMLMDWTRIGFETVTIADDAQGYVTFSDYNMYGGMVLIAGANLSGAFPQPQWALFYVDAGTSLNAVLVAQDATTDWLGVATPSVAACTDNQTTISIQSDNVKITNREGSSRTYSVYIFGGYG